MPNLITNSLDHEFAVPEECVLGLARWHLVHVSDFSSYN